MIQLKICERIMQDIDKEIEDHRKHNPNGGYIRGLVRAKKIIRFNLGDLQIKDMLKDIP